MQPPTRNPWLVRPPRVPDARWRLFCFPYAGGAANIYRGWGELLEGTVAGGLEVIAVELPGRATRFREAPCRAIAQAVAGAGEAMAPLLDRPFAFFGHSLGAILAFELARWLRREARPQPRRLFLSARRAPHLPDDEEPISGLSDEEFVGRLRELNGTPEEALQHPELMRMLLPVLRADFAMVDSYRLEPEPPLALPLAAWGGLSDPEVSREALEAWSLYTSAGFGMRMFPGDHFYLHPQRQAMVRAIAQDLASDGV